MFLEWRRCFHRLKAKGSRHGWLEGATTINDHCVCFNMLTRVIVGMRTESKFTVVVAHRFREYCANASTAKIESSLLEFYMIERLV
jgi:hypothetical protein